MEDAPQSPWRKWRKPAFTLAGVVAFLLAAGQVRDQIGLELNSESIQRTVGELGLLAPLGYVMLTMFRQVFALPSMLVLTSGGLLFGAPMGTLLGGIGVTLNAFTLYVVARMAGRDWVLPKIHARWPDFEARSKTAGPWVIALMTGHPMGVLTPFHFAAGVTGIAAHVFLASVGPAAVFRAGCYSFLGANILEPGSSGLWIASGVLVVAAVLPLLHPGLRARLLSGRSKPAAREGDHAGGHPKANAQKESGDPETGSPL